ncbi:hypothetical protein MHYP_G00256760 [Metynnis hypsauchen]
MKMQLIQVVFYLWCSPGLMADNKWSMTVPEAVDQNIGEDAIIPCSFTAPYQDYQEKYFCRVELSKQGGAYETSTGTILNIRAVPQALESIYIKTRPSGEQFVSCDVKGTPPPTVTWIFPENMNASLVSVQSGLSRASSSIPANLPNTNYTCQIHGKNRTQHLSIYFRGAQEQQHQIPFPLFLVVTILSGVFLILFVVTLAALYEKGSSEPVDTATKMKIMKTKYTEKEVSPGEALPLPLEIGAPLAMLFSRWWTPVTVVVFYSI